LVFRLIFAGSIARESLIFLPAVGYPVGMEQNDDSLSAMVQSLVQ
jgi:hypothetical protein